LENVRTIHRLGPVFFAHFVQILALGILINLMYFNAVDILLMKFFIILYMFLHSIALLVIIVAVIL
jgi:hypothetical protein